MNPLSWFDPDDPYPESDGEPMAENTRKFDWIVLIKENLEVLFADDPNVFVAGDLLWYPHPERRVTGPLAPDAMVVFGRPKGPRGCYKQWEEDGIGPQVVFEVLSPANSIKQMADKRDFYDTWGVEEYYVYDPDANTLEVWQRTGTADGRPGRLQRMSHLNGWVSPRLGVRFALTPQTLELYDPAGRPFLNMVGRATAQRLEAARAEAAAAAAWREANRAAAAEAQAAEAAARAAAAEARAAALEARLRALGIEP